MLSNLKQGEEITDLTSSSQFASNFSSDGVGGGGGGGSSSFPAGGESDTDGTFQLGELAALTVNNDTESASGYDVRLLGFVSFKKKMWRKMIWSSLFLFRLYRCPRSGMGVWERPGPPSTHSVAILTECALWRFTRRTWCWWRGRMTGLWSIGICSAIITGTRKRPPSTLSRCIPFEAICKNFP